MRTVYIEIAHEINEDLFRRARKNAHAQALEDIDLNGYDVQVIRGDFTSTELDQVDSTATTGLIRLHRDIERIVSGEIDR